jgi:hypothetical protein
MSPTYTKRIEAARKQEDARQKREEQERSAAAERHAAEPGEDRPAESIADGQEGCG